jgi:hypothetical protein
MRTTAQPFYDSQVGARQMKPTETHLVLHPHAISRTVEGEEVIVLPKTGQVAVLNDVGTRIWALADGRHSLQDIVDTIVEEFDVTPERAGRDVAAFARELVEKKMLELTTERVEE